MSLHVPRWQRTIIYVYRVKAAGLSSIQQQTDTRIEYGNTMCCGERDSCIFIFLVNQFNDSNYNISSTDCDEMSRRDDDIDLLRNEWKVMLLSMWLCILPKPNLPKSDRTDKQWKANAGQDEKWQKQNGGDKRSKMAEWVALIEKVVTCD